MSDDIGEPAAARRFVHWIVEGRVQGVGFRYHVLQAASERGVRGDVRNLPDGRVEIRAEGTEAELQGLLRSVRRGPRSARVDALETVDSRAVDAAGLFRDFTIRH